MSKRVKVALIAGITAFVVAISGGVIPGSTVTDLLCRVGLCATE